MEKLAPRTAYYPALTGLRAVAAALVFFYHFNPFKGPPPLSSVAGLLGAVLDTGTGLNIFFVMSGFVITTRYVDRVELSWAWAKHYLLNRFARIYPLYFLLTAATFAAMAGHLVTWYTFGEEFTTKAKVIAVLTNLTLTRGLFYSFRFVGVPTAWSLTVEEAFYVTAPFLLLLLRRRRGLLPVLALGLLGAGLVIGLVSARLELYAGFMQPLSFVLQFTYFGRCIEFLTGIGLALWLQKRGPALARRGTTLLGIGLLGAAPLVASFVLAPAGLPEWARMVSESVVANVWVCSGVAVLFHGLLHEPTWLQQLLETKLFGVLGKSTYAFYLIHLGLFNDLLQRAIGYQVLLSFFVFGGAAVLLYKLIEQPLHTAIIRRFRPGPR